MSTPFQLQSVAARDEESEAYYKKLRKELHAALPWSAREAQKGSSACYHMDLDEASGIWTIRRLEWKGVGEMQLGQVDDSAVAWGRMDWYVRHDEEVHEALLALASSPPLFEKFCALTERCAEEMPE